MSLDQRLEGGRRIDTQTDLIMPWYTSPCLEWLLTIDLNGKIIWEYGVGDSTLWYKKMGSYTHGVDHAPWWADNFDNVFHETSKDAYVRSIYRAPTEFDLVVIDGIYRDECTEHALSQLKSGGYLIIDNWKQPSADLEHWPLTEKLIEGMPITVYKEPDHYDWQTAVIQKP